MREEVDEQDKVSIQSSRNIEADATELEQAEVSTKVAAWQEERQGKKAYWTTDQIKTFGKNIAKIAKLA